MNLSHQAICDLCANSYPLASFSTCVVLNLKWLINVSQCTAGNVPSPQKVLQHSCYDKRDFRPAGLSCDLSVTWGSVYPLPPPPLLVLFNHRESIKQNRPCIKSGPSDFSVSSMGFNVTVLFPFSVFFTVSCCHSACYRHFVY